MSGVNLGEDPSKDWEHSEYAEPIPTPAPKATDAQRVAGLPDAPIIVRQKRSNFKILGQEHVL